MSRLTEVNTSNIADAIRMGCEVMGRVFNPEDEDRPYSACELGWVMESSREDNLLDQGEGNNTGDLVETALILGRWGWPEYYEDAERILRCHLLPAQLRDVSWIEEPDNPEGLDCLRDLAERNRGSWGFPAPYGLRPIEAEGMGFHLDIVGGVVGSLCEA